MTGAGPLTLRLVDEDRDVPLDEDPFCIGRDRRNHLVLPDEGVSAFHCRIRRAGRRLLLEDRGSTNGTFLNDVRVFASELRVGGRIGLAQRRLRLCGPATAGARPYGSAAAARYAIVGQDPAIVRLVERIERVAPTRATVLIIGESGSGKELVARALHVAGERPGGPFVVLNCAAIARDLAESELFGHERGAFTGAVARRRGVFEEAAGGTLFLDEIGELAPGLQAKLLRVLETGAVRPVGGAHEVRVAVRVVAATHRRLARGGGGGPLPARPLPPPRPGHARGAGAARPARRHPAAVRALPRRGRGRGGPAQPRPRRARACCAARRGPATCASCGTSCSGPRSSAARW